MHSKNIDKCDKNPQSIRRKPNSHTKCGKNCHKILSVQQVRKFYKQKDKSHEFPTEMLIFQTLIDTYEKQIRSSSSYNMSLSYIKKFVWKLFWS